MSLTCIEQLENNGKQTQTCFIEFHSHPSHTDGCLVNDDLKTMKGQEGFGVIVAGKGQDVLQLC